MSTSPLGHISPERLRQAADILDELSDSDIELVDNDLATTLRYVAFCNQLDVSEAVNELAREMWVVAADNVPVTGYGGWPDHPEALHFVRIARHLVANGFGKLDTLSWLHAEAVWRLDCMRNYVEDDEPRAMPVHVPVQVRDAGDKQFWWDCSCGRTGQLASSPQGGSRMPSGMFFCETLW